MNRDFVPHDFSGSNAITHSGIAKHFNTVKPCDALAELVWNGFDAGANNITVTITRNQLGGPESICILDDGAGINFRNPEENFQRFNDSLKRDSYDTHGSHGRGRLAFHKVCHTATWFTRYSGEDAKIVVSSENLSKMSGTTIASSQQHALVAQQKSGTCVELSQFPGLLPSDEQIADEFSKEFGAHLVLMPHKRLRVNSIRIEPQEHTLHSTTFQVRNTVFDVDLIEWHEKPRSEKSYLHFVSTSQKVLLKQYSSLNKKPGYYTSIFIKSPALDYYSSDRDGLSEPISAFIEGETCKTLLKELNTFMRQKYAEFLIRLAQEKVDQYEENGDFPPYSDLDAAESAWRLQHVKEIVKAVLIREPKIFVGSNKSQRRLIIRLLDKLAVSNENSAIFDILESVLKLDDSTMNKLADQLKKTKLDNIVQTIEVLQNRELAISQLKQIMNIHFNEVRETPDLQAIIENNTWLFGASYDILGAEEESFTAIARKLRDKIDDVNEISHSDVSEGATIEGCNKQVDLLLVRRKPQFDARNRKYFRCIIVEIKRPGVALNNKHLRQIDEYASILSNYPEFNSELMKFELILVGRTISKEAHLIHSRLRTSQIHGENGLITSDDKIKTYVKTWPTIFDEFELSNEYLLERLKTQRADLSAMTKDELLSSLQGKSEEAQPA